MKKLLAFGFVFFSSAFFLNCTTTEEAASTPKGEAAAVTPSNTSQDSAEATVKNAATENKAEAEQTMNANMKGKKGMRHHGMKSKGMHGAHAKMKDPALHEKLAKAHLDAANCLKSGKSAKECPMVMPPEAGMGKNKKDHSHEHFTQEMHTKMAEVHGKVATCLKAGKPAGECTQMLDACPMAGKDAACQEKDMGKMGPGKKEMKPGKGKMR